MLLKRTILQELLKSAAQHSRSQFGSKLSHGCVHLTESWQRRFLSSGASFSRAISPSVCARGQAGPLQCHQLCYRPLYGRDAEDVSKPRSLRGPTKSQGLGSPRRTRLARGRAKSLETPVSQHAASRRPSAEIPAQLAMWLLPRGVTVCNFGCSPASLTPFGLRGLKGKGFLCTGCSVCVSRAGHLTSAGAQALCGRLLTPPPCVTRGRGRTRASTAGTFSQSQARCPCLQFASGSALPAAPPDGKAGAAWLLLYSVAPSAFYQHFSPPSLLRGRGAGSRWIWGPLPELGYLAFQRLLVRPTCYIITGREAALLQRGQLLWYTRGALPGHPGLCPRPVRADCSGLTAASFLQSNALAEYCLGTWPYIPPLGWQHKANDWLICYTKGWALASKQTILGCSFGPRALSCESGQSQSLSKTTSLFAFSLYFPA